MVIWNLLHKFLYFFFAVLPELPLPTPLPHTVNNKSLLYHPDIAAEAKRILGHPDDNVVRQLVQALSHTSTDHM